MKRNMIALAFAATLPVLSLAAPTAAMAHSHGDVAAALVGGFALGAIANNAHNNYQSGPYYSYSAQPYRHSRYDNGYYYGGHGHHHHRRHHGHHHHH